MAYKITVYEVTPPQSAVQIEAETTTPIYEQRVETLDMRKLIDAVNFKPRVRRSKEETAKTRP